MLQADKLPSSRLLLLFLTILLGALVFSLLPQKPAAANAKRQTQPTPRKPQRTPQIVYAPLVGLPEMSGGEIAFNNNGPEKMEVSTTFFTADGAATPGRKVALNALEVKHLNLSELLPAALQREPKLGGVQLAYVGVPMEVVAQITLFGQGRAGSIDVPFSAAMDYRTNTLDAVWWMPRPGTAGLILGNASNAPFSAVLSYENGRAQEIRLAAHATEVVRLHSQELGNISPQAEGFAASVAIKHNGLVGDLRVAGFVMSANKRYTSTIQFYDAQMARQQNLYATSLKVKNATPHLTLKNKANAPITAKPRFLPAAGIRGEALELPPVTIPANRSVEVDLRPLMAAAQNREELANVSVHIASDGANGALIGALSSFEAAAQLTHTVPLRDSGPIRNSTGGYPWQISGDYSTVVSITNVGPSPAKFIATINYANGRYSFPTKELALGETVVFDLKKLRDEQKPDKDGKLLPRNLPGGQFHWSVIETNGLTRLIGRTEVVNPVKNVSSSFSCPVCCPDSGPYGSFAPGAYTLLVDSFAFVNAAGDYYNCYGGFSYGGTLVLYNLFVTDPACVAFSSPSSYEYKLDGMGAGAANFGGQYNLAEWDDDGMDCYVSNSSPETQGNATVVRVTFQKSDGSALPSPLRVGITANNHDRRQQLRAVIEPASEAANITISVSSKLQKSDQSTSGGVITFKIVGTAKSDSRGDQTITAMHSSGTTSNHAVSVVVPAKIATPHDTTGTLVIANRGLNSTTSPALINVSSSNVNLATVYVRFLAVTVVDQFSDLIGNIYQGATVTEDGVLINQTLTSASVYSDPVGTGLYGPVVSVNSTEAMNWPSQPLRTIPFPYYISPPPQNFSVEIDGFALNPAIVNRSWTVGYSGFQLSE